MTARGGIWWARSPFFILLTALLTAQGIVPYKAGANAPPSLRGGFASLAKAVWWSNAALCLAGFVRMFLIFERRPRGSFIHY